VQRCKGKAIEQPGWQRLCKEQEKKVREGILLKPGRKRIMEWLYYIMTGLLALTALLPLIPHPHWIFRVWEFGRIQAFALQVAFLLLGFLLVREKDTLFWGSQGFLFLLALNNALVLYPYTKWYRTVRKAGAQKQSESISVLSVNVYQFNDQYERLIRLVREKQPDVLLTMESNGGWDQALSVLEKDYPSFRKVPLENTYGMHFYTRLKSHRIDVHFFVSGDLPSIEAELETPDGQRFTFFGVHPAPPSPTEEETARERDGELLSIAKKARATPGPVLVVGDFNNVAWARSSILFRKTSELIDPRIGRGFVSTFHADYQWLRFPIDLFFHTPDIFVEEFCTLQHIGSDHLPLYCRFYLNTTNPVQEPAVEHLENEKLQEVDEIIEKGKEEESDRPAVAG